MATTISTTSKKEFVASCLNFGVNAGYCGKTNTMYISGEDSKVKSFIRIYNLSKNKASFPVRQSKV